MPIEAQQLMDQGETLLDVCLETHMATTGASDMMGDDMMDDEWKVRNRRILETAVENWTPSSPRHLRFDNAVLEIVKATLEEMESYGRVA